MTTTFKVAPHAEKPGNQMVEVWIDGVFVGALYPMDNDLGCGCRFVSKYLQAATLDESFPPSVDILLDRQRS